jgi:hypothetical protein
VLSRLLSLEGGPLWAYAGSLSGERAYVSRCGDTERSIPRFGRGGILGMSMWEVGAGDELF